jgi:hypothetical protein
MNQPHGSRTAVDPASTLEHESLHAETTTGLL